VAVLNRLVVLAVTAATLVACADTDATPSDAEVTAYAETAPPLGEPVEFVVDTHCGVDSLRLDGRWWHAEEPLYGEGGPGSAPEGWGDPYQTGELTLVSEQSVVFEAEGTRIEFAPAADDRPMRICR
jgi:hypothetical protein